MSYFIIYVLVGSQVVRGRHSLDYTNTQIRTSVLNGGLVRCHRYTNVKTKNPLAEAQADESDYTSPKRFQNYL